MSNYTPLDQIEPIINSSKKFYTQRQQFLSHEKNPKRTDLQFRLTQLKSLYWAIKDHESDIVEALYKDFHRSTHETITLEIIPLLNNVLYLINNLPKFMKHKSLRDNSIPYLFGNIYIEKISLGTVLVISPFNFPLLLALDPIACAIAGGNSVVWKPSESTPHITLVTLNILKSLESGLVNVVQGSVVETTKLLASGLFDKIFYTGSSVVGSIVAQEAGKSLTPCILELGGKSPVFFTNHFNKSDFNTALRRIFFSSFGNSGQICVAADYLIVHESIYDDLIEAAKQILLEMWPELDSEIDYTFMVHQQSYDRAIEKLRITNGSIFTSIKDTSKLPHLCISPTIISDLDWNDPLMKEENFAPILPVIKYSNLDMAIDKVLELHDTPLVQYIFSNNQKEINHILTRVRSGGCIIGDTMIHVGISDAPFGGIGLSGYGNYHGVYSFDAFTHSRTIFKQPFWNDFMLNIRYAPFTDYKTRIATFGTEMKPSFDRNGNPVWKTQYIFLLGLFGCGLGYLANKHLT